MAKVQQVIPISYHSTRGITTGASAGREPLPSTLSTSCLVR